MQSLYLSLTPNTVHTLHGEPAESDIQNQIVFQLLNVSEDRPVELLNSDPSAERAFGPYDSAEAIDGLSCFYLHFPLGAGDDRLTSESLFKAATLHTPDGWLCAQPEAGTLVLYPEKTRSIEPGAGIEFMLDRLITDIRADTVALCDIKYVGIDPGRIAEAHTPIYKVRCPLSIQLFTPAIEDVVTGFRDVVRLHWRVVGADSVMLKPGDISLKKADDPEQPFYLTVIEKTHYQLVAQRGQQQLTTHLLLSPLQARIEPFVTTTDAAAANPSVTWRVRNTRHAFLSTTGRIDATSGTVNVPSGAHFTVTVENADGLVTQSITTP